MINKIVQLIELIQYTSVFQCFKVIEKTRSIASSLNSLFLKNAGIDFQTVIDIGANRGQFTKSINFFFPGKRIIAFEPIKELSERFSKDLSSFPNIEIHNIALGNKEGSHSFYQHKYSHISSFLTVSSDNKYDQKNDDFTIITVPVKRLEDMWESLNISAPTLMKIDVQGFEQDVILGCGKYLKKVDYIMIEMSFFEMYENENLFFVMNQFLNTKGFRLFFPLGFFKNKMGIILQADFLYKRDSS